MSGQSPDGQAENRATIQGSGFQFETTYTDLPQALHRFAEPSQAPSPKVTLLNGALAKELGLTLDNLSAEQQAELLTGHTLAEGLSPLRKRMPATSWWLLHPG